MGPRRGPLSQPLLDEDALMKFAPYTIDEQSHNAIMAYLGELPAKYANGLISELNKRAASAAETAQNESTAPKK